MPLLHAPPLFRRTVKLRCGDKLRDKVPSAVAKCISDRFKNHNVQSVQLLPGGDINVTFEHVLGKVTVEGYESVSLFDHVCPVVPSGPPLTLVQVHHFPFEGSWESVKLALRPYGEIKECSFQHFPDVNQISTGTRLVRMVRKENIPRLLIIDGFPVTTWYRGQPLECNICKKNHKAIDCPLRGRCRRCGEEGHYVKDCQQAWGPRVAAAPFAGVALGSFPPLAPLLSDSDSSESASVADSDDSADLSAGDDKSVSEVADVSEDLFSPPANPPPSAPPSPLVGAGASVPPSPDFVPPTLSDSSGGNISSGNISGPVLSSELAPEGQLVSPQHCPVVNAGGASVKVSNVSDILSSSNSVNNISNTTSSGPSKSIMGLVMSGHEECIEESSCSIDSNDSGNSTPMLGGADVASLSEITEGSGNIPGAIQPGGIQNVYKKDKNSIGNIDSPNSLQDGAQAASVPEVTESSSNITGAIQPGKTKNEHKKDKNKDKNKDKSKEKNTVKVKQTNSGNDPIDGCSTGLNPPLSMEVQEAPGSVAKRKLSASDTDVLEEGELPESPPVSHVPPSGGGASSGAKKKKTHGAKKSRSKGGGSHT